MRPDVNKLIEDCFSDSVEEASVEKVAAEEQELAKEQLRKQASAEASLKMIAILDALNIAGN